MPWQGSPQFRGSWFLLVVGKGTEDEGAVGTPLPSVVVPSRDETLYFGPHTFYCIKQSTVPRVVSFHSIPAQLSPLLSLLIGRPMEHLEHHHLKGSARSCARLSWFHEFQQLYLPTYLPTYINTLNHLRETSDSTATYEPPHSHQTSKNHDNTIAR